MHRPSGGNRRRPLHQALRPQQPPHTRRGRRIHPLALAELELVQQHADLETFEQPQRPDVGQVGGDELGEPARQRLHGRVSGDHQRQHRHRGGLGRLVCELCLARQRLSGRSLRRGTERELRLGAQRGHASGPRVSGRKVGVSGDRLVVASRPLLAGADHEWSERVVGLALERRASHNGGGVAPPGGGERRAAPKRRQSTGLWSASARDGHAQQKKREPRLHRRDFFFPVFFLTSALGRAGRTGLALDLRTSTSASTRSPSSGPIRPRRTA